MGSHRKFGLLVILIVLGFDQFSKWWLLFSLMDPPSIITISPYLNIVLVWNRGVSFGLFNDGGAMTIWVLSILALGICTVLFIWLFRSENYRSAIALGLIIGGALGNVADRLFHSAVLDFIDVHIGNYHWPAFNVADSSITVGAIILVIDSLFLRSKTLE